MCHIFASQDPATYQPVTRAIRLNGHITSIRLEAQFWDLLAEIAEREGMALPRFIGRLYDEVLDLHGDVGNFTSLLRVTCVLYLRRDGSRLPAPLPLIAAGRGAAREKIDA